MAEIYDYTTGEIREETSAENPEVSIKDKPEKEWVTDIIGEDYKEWGNEIVLLGIGTGRGKTTFALDVYCKWLTEQQKRVLYLCNRIKLKEQMDYKVDDLEKELEERKKGPFGKERGELTVTTYQKVEYLFKKEKQFLLDYYDVFICDEAHYFLSDAMFNHYTDLSYIYLMSRKENTTIVMMTATYKNILKQLTFDLGKEPRVYIAPTDYSYVKKKILYRKNDIHMIIRDILESTEDKILCFFNSLRRMEEFYQACFPDDIEVNEEDTILKDIDFFCSQNQKDNENQDFYKKHVNPNAVILEEGLDGEYYTFSKRVLITTKTLDNGVDFKDRNLKHIICEIVDIESAIQCLGRRRMLDEDDYCSFYIRDYGRNVWKYYIDEIIKDLIEPRLFLDDPDRWRIEYLNQRDRELNPCVYFDEQGTPRLNNLKYNKLSSELKIFQSFEDNDTRYASEILNELSHGNTDAMYDMTTDLFHEGMVKELLMKFIHDHKGKILTPGERKVLVYFCNIRNDRNQLLRGEKVISEYLLSKPFECRIEKHRMDDGTYAWSIESKFANKSKKSKKNEEKKKTTRKRMAKKRGGK